MQVSRFGDFARRRDPENRGRGRDPVSPKGTESDNKIGPFQQKVTTKLAHFNRTCQQNGPISIERAKKLAHLKTTKKSFKDRL